MPTGTRSNGRHTGVKRDASPTPDDHVAKRVKTDPTDADNLARGEAVGATQAGEHAGAPNAHPLPPVPLSMEGARENTIHPQHVDRNGAENDVVTNTVMATGELQVHPNAVTTDHGTQMQPPEIHAAPENARHIATRQEDNAEARQPAAAAAGTGNTPAVNPVEVNATHAHPAAFIGPLEVNPSGYLPERAVQRLNHAAGLVRGTRAPLANLVPADTHWGGWQSQWLCLHNTVVVVLFLARIRSIRMYAGEQHEPLKSASMRFRFLRDADVNMARTVINDACKPPRVSHKRTFYASCPTVRNHQPYLFREIYDGTRQFGPKATMQRITDFSIHDNDVCLVEAKIQRYDPSGQHTWANGWVTSFYLMSLTKMYSAPDSFHSDPESDRDEVVVVSDDEMEVF